MAQAKRAADREWLDGREVNVFLKRAQKKPRFKELAIERICQARVLIERHDRSGETRAGLVRVVFYFVGRSSLVLKETRCSFLLQLEQISWVKFMETKQNYG